MKMSIFIATFCAINSFMALFANPKEFGEYGGWLVAALGWAFAASREHIIAKGEAK